MQLRPAVLPALTRDPVTEAIRAAGVFLGYQQDWSADDSPFKVIEKSRRVGLSWAEAADSVLLASAAAGMDVWYVGYNKDMAQEFILDCGEWAKHLEMAVGEIAETEEVFVEGDDKQSILAYVIRFASGFRITALSSRPSNLRGKQGRVIIDEAAFHDNLPELLKAAMALLIWGGQVHVISTHNGVDNPFNELINDIRSGRRKGTVHRVTFNNALDAGLYKRVCQKTSIPWTQEGQDNWEKEIRSYYGSAVAEELDCVPSQSAGAYLSRALVESRMDARIPVLRLACPEHFEQRPEAVRIAFVQEWLLANVKPLIDALPKRGRSYYGLDFARSSDLSVFAPLIEDQLLHRRCPFLIEMRNVPFKQQEQLVFWIADRLPRFGGGAHDSRGNGQYLGEVAMQKYGATMVHQIMLTQQWYIENMPKYKAALEDGNVTLPKDDDVLTDHRAIQLVKGVPKVPEGAHTKDATDGGARHGDTAIAFALAWFASLHPGSIIEFESIVSERIGAGCDDYLGAL